VLYFVSKAFWQIVQPAHLVILLMVLGTVLLFTRRRRLALGVRNPWSNWQGPTIPKICPWKHCRVRSPLDEAWRRWPYRKTVKVALVHLDTTGQSERVVDAIRATAADIDEDIREMQNDEAMTRRAVDLLGSRRNDAYEAALAALREDTQAWWADVLASDPGELEEGEEPATADAEGLRRFLEAEVSPWFKGREKELTNRPLIREQAFGEALDPDKLERLGRYEVHLDRKLERMLTMLLRLKDLRRGTAAV
jgi:hypothetical protein